MGFWNWFQGRMNVNLPQGERYKKKLDPKIAKTFSRVKRDIKTMRTDLADMNAQLAQQNSKITENTRLINNHSAQLEKLEDIVSSAPVILTPQNQPTNRLSQPISRPNQPTSRLVATKPTRVERSDRLDMDCITEQEKRIIGVFLAHCDMSLSYQDIAKSLDKSPYTVKNQMRQINMKANLFDRMVDSQGKNRFKLRKRLKLEANLIAD